MSVIQGSLLGPILFLIFINDFPNCTNLNTYLFADDTTPLKSGSDLPTLFNLINIELQKIATWYRANKMSANASKTKYIIFHKKGKTDDTNGLNLLFNDNEPNDIDNITNIHILEGVYSTSPNPSSPSYKLLVIHLDENLSLNTYYSVLSAKLSRALFFLRRAKNLLPHKALLTLYYSLFHCHLLYCPNILGMTSSSNISKISLLQRKAIRIITSSHNRSHTTPNLFLPQYTYLPRNLKTSQVFLYAFCRIQLLL